jgi:hypothetical protein
MRPPEFLSAGRHQLLHPIGSFHQEKEVSSDKSRDQQPQDEM